MHMCENKLEISKQVIGIIIQCYVYVAVTHLSLTVFNLSTTHIGFRSCCYEHCYFRG